MSLPDGLAILNGDETSVECSHCFGQREDVSSITLKHFYVLVLTSTFSVLTKKSHKVAGGFIAKNRVTRFRVGLFDEHLRHF
jgi:hypothetical protein